MDEELRQHLEAMESRLMGRINGVMKRLLEVETNLRGDLRDLRSEHDTTRELVSALPATVLKAIEQPLLRRED
jgi:hypothetical protein